MDSFSARDASFSQIITDFRPRVPQLQRNYSWGPTQWKDLWDDLVGFYEDHSTNDRPYFIGTVVLVDAENGNIEILDGQQRLATLTIFMSAIVNALKQYDNNRSVMFEEGSILSTNDDDSRSPYITLNMYDGKFFRKYVQERDFGTPADIESHRLIKKAMTFFGEQIAEYIATTDINPAQWLRNMGMLIQQKVRFAYVKSDPSDSYQVFRVLNDRGKSLSQLDLFRTFLLQQAGAADADEIAKNWTHILDIDAPGSPDDLLRFYWITQRGDIKSQRLFRDIKYVVEKGEKPAKNLAEELFFFSDFYKDLIAASASDDEVRDLYQDILDLRAKSLYPMLMAARFAVESGHGNMIDFKRLLRLAVRLFVRHTLVCGLENFRLETVVYKAAREIVAERTLTQAINDLKSYAAETVPDSRFVQDFASCDIRYEAAAKCVLRSIEQREYNRSELKVPSSKDLHLEHILPRRPPADVKLTDHEHWLWKLGNLTLLDGSLNRKAGNKALQAKKSVYADSHIRMTQELCSADAWGPEQIADRQRRLAEKAALVWSIDA